MARIVLGITPAARQGHISIYAGMTCEPSLTVGLIPREDGDFASCEPSLTVGLIPLEDGDFASCEPSLTVGYCLGRTATSHHASPPAQSDKCPA
jgi:hypothetical protein